jgi:hypothetical protein
VLGGVSHLHHLVAGSGERPAPFAAVPGPIYTGDAAPPARDYECTRCGAVRRVGRGARFRTVGELKASGCGGDCSSTSFRPRARSAR